MGHRREFPLVAAVIRRHLAMAPREVATGCALFTVEGWRAMQDDVREASQHDPGIFIEHINGETIDDVLNPPALDTWCEAPDTSTGQVRRWINGDEEPPF